MPIDRSFMTNSQVSITEKSLWKWFLDLYDSSTTTAASITTGSLTGTAAPFPIAGFAAAQGGAVTVTGGASSSSANAGGAVTSVGGAGGATGAGGAINLTGAAGGGTSGVGGALVLVAGAGTAGNSAGGAVTITSGAGQGSAAGGAVTITSGAAGATGVAGVVTIQVSAATAGAGSALNLKGGAGAGGTAAGGNIDLAPGAAVTSGVPGEVTVAGVAGTFELTYTAPLMTTAVPATGTAQPIYIATRKMRVKAVQFCVVTKGTSEAFTITKDAAAAAPGAGTALLTAPIAIAAANTAVAGTLVATVATVTLAAGDRLSFLTSGTIGIAAGLTVTLLLVPA